eukprot:GHVO01014136.1.p1 GENE.GHVO01014136.1~~GHVO01014136.1.p1  ORF type:complete len:273 (+),score=31.18 GHVO01014136.1:120-821(+)
MDEFDAFCAFTNLLSRTSLYSFYTFDLPKIEVYFRAFDILLREKVPKVSRKLKLIGLSSDLFLVEWLFTLFTRCLPVDLVARIWDMYFAFGDVVLFQISIGIISYFEKELQNGSQELCITILSSSTTDHFDAIDTERFLENVDSLNITDEKLNRTLRIAKSEHDRFHRQGRNANTDGTGKRKPSVFVSLTAEKEKTEGKGGRSGDEGPRRSFGKTAFLRISGKGVKRPSRKQE